MNSSADGASARRAERGREFRLTILVLTKTALSAQSKAVYQAYVIDERPIGEVAAEFKIPRNSVSQIKTRVERMIAAIESEF